MLQGNLGFLLQGWGRGLWLVSVTQPSLPGIPHNVDGSNPVLRATHVPAALLNVAFTEKTEAQGHGKGPDQGHRATKQRVG